MLWSYTLLLVALGAAIVIGAVPTADVLLHGLLWIPLMAAANMTRLTVAPQIGIDGSLASIVLVAGALLLPPPAVALFAFVGLLHPNEVHRRAPLVLALFNRAQFALSVWVAAVVAAAVMDGSPLRLVLAAALASLAFTLANDALVAVVTVIRYRVTWRQALADVSNPVPRFALNEAVSATLSLLLAVMIRDVGWWSVLLLLAPLWLSHSAQQSARRAQDRAEELAARVRQLEMLNMLSDRLLRVRDESQVPAIASHALGVALGDRGVGVDLDGHQQANATNVAIAGAAPAVIAIPGELDDADRATVDASAALVGLALTRLRVEAELAETERARTALTARILEEATHERSRIALAVHDEVLPLFAAAQMRIDTLEIVLERDPAEASKMLDAAMDAVTDGIAELRDTLESLRRNTLVPGTLRDGMSKLLAEFQTRTGVKQTLVAADPLPALSFAVELLVFETVRGALANVEKHARARSLRVELDVDDGRLVLAMHDDGRGYDPATVGRRSHGLALMRQRASLAGGRFDICGAPGVGTTVKLEVPVW